MAEDPANQQPQAAKISKKTMLVLSISAAVLILVSVIATLWVSSFLGKTSSPNSEHKSKVVGPAIYMTLTPNFIVNFNINGRQRYLQAEISLMFRAPELEQQLALHLPAVRNSVVMLLNKQDFESLHTVQGKDALRKDILEAVSEILRVENALLAKNKSTPSAPATIEQVLFTNFVMQ